MKMWNIFFSRIRYTCWICLEYTEVYLVKGSIKYRFFVLQSYNESVGELMVQGSKTQIKSGFFQIVQRNIAVSV